MRWGFENIEAAEETHTQIVARLLDRYDVADPTQGRGPGQYENPEFTALYARWTAEGLESEAQALRVGALIEETDLVALQRALSGVTAPEVRTAFEALSRGSRNHLRAFVRVLERRGVHYAPTRLSQAEFEAIVNAEHEAGPGRRWRR